MTEMTAMTFHFQPHNTLRLSAAATNEEISSSISRHKHQSREHPRLHQDARQQFSLNKTRGEELPGLGQNTTKSVKGTKKARKLKC